MSKRISLLVICVLSLAIISGGCGNRQAETANTTENFPVKPINVIVPFPPGGSADMLARTVGEVSTRYIGQNMIVINKPGGGATIGWNELASAQPDGYTLGITSVNLILQSIYRETEYDYPTALEPLAQISVTPIVAVVQAAGPWQNLDDFILYAKQNPGKIKFGHAGLGTVQHVVGETLAKEAEIKIEQVPFRGATEEITALLGGHIQLLFATPAEVKEQVKSGTVRVLAVSDSKRISQMEFADVPTFKEKGIDIIYNLWQGIGVPKGLPSEVKAKLAKQMYDTIHDAKFRRNLENLGIDIEYLGPEDSAAKWLSEKARLTKVIKETGLAEQIAAQKN